MHDPAGVGATRVAVADRPGSHLLELDVTFGKPFFSVPISDILVPERSRGSVERSVCRTMDFDASGASSRPGRVWVTDRSSVRVPHSQQSAERGEFMMGIR